MFLYRPGGALVALLAAHASFGHPVSKSPARSCADNSRACLERVARSYIARLVTHDGDGLPLANLIRRTENALTNAKGPNEVRESFARTDMVKAARDVRLFVDQLKGEVIAFFLLDVDLNATNGGGSGITKAGNSEYKVAVTKPAGTYTVHEAERFKVVQGKITDIEIIAHVEDRKGLGSGWPTDRDVSPKTGEQK